MALKTFVTGEVLTAADVNTYLVNSVGVRKTANESVTSSTTLQDDDELFVSVAANFTYEVSCMLKYDGATTGDFKIQWNVPASATFDYSILRLQTGASDATAVALDYGQENVDMVMGAIGSGTTATAMILGTLIVAGTAGTFGLKWAQGTSSATATRILTRSMLVARRAL